MSPPTISSIYPSQGSKYGYTNIIVSGTNMSAVNAVKFSMNETLVDAVSFEIYNSLNIKVVSPAYIHVLSNNETVETRIIIYNSDGNSNINANTSIFVYTNFPVYVGIQNALTATGGFTVEEGFPRINIKSTYEGKPYDVTTSLQLAFDVRKFNSLLGLIKDANNRYILNTTLDMTTVEFPNDSITLSAPDFVNGLTAPQVTSLGTYSSLYNDFSQAVNEYFSYGLFAPLMDTINYDASHNGIFDANAFINIITPHAIDSSGAYVNAVTGSITLDNVNGLLRQLVMQNVYNNRAALIDNDPHFTPGNEECYGVHDGFIDGDLIYVESGISITLELQLTNAPPNFATYIYYHPDMQNINCNYCGDYSNFSSSSSTTVQGNSMVSAISRTITAPLFISLRNLTTDPYIYNPELRPPA